jgi:Fur family transcriptional regulator, ferric uptake regulator
MDNFLQNKNLVDDAKQMIEQAGLRTTDARLAVLNTLISAKTALSWAEVIDRLPKDYPFDRVTIYRVLEWLTEAHMVHKIPSDDRAMKFQVTLPNTTHQHAHLHCTHCHKIICLDELQPNLSQQITTQFQVESVDMIIKGRCAACKV